MTWTDTIKSPNAAYINTYKVLENPNQTIILSLTGISKSISSKPVPSLKSPSSTSESRESTYNGKIELLKTTGFIQKLEIKRESEIIEELMNTKISSITTTKTVTINKVL